MRATLKQNFIVVLAVLFATSSFVRAQDPKALQQQLESKYALTSINAEGGVVIQGATLTLKKNGLTGSAKAPCTNDYKDGRISAASASKATCSSATRRFAGLPGISAIPGIGGAAGTAQGAAAAPATRPFVAGEKLYITKIEVKDVVAFFLISDAINDVTYKAEIRFQPAKGEIPDLGQADRMIAEVFTVAAADAQQQSAAGGQAAAAPAPQAAAPPAQPELPEIAPPPPPPDQPAAPPQTVSLGQTIDQVVAILGQPATVADLGKKKIYTYRNPGLKVTFVDGKVTDMQ